MEEVKTDTPVPAVEKVLETERPFKIFAVLDGIENFHSGYEVKDSAEASLVIINKSAKDLELKTKYILKG